MRSVTLKLKTPVCPCVHRVQDPARDFKRSRSCYRIRTPLRTPGFQFFQMLEFFWNFRLRSRYIFWKIQALLIKKSAVNFSKTRELSDCEHIWLGLLPESCWKYCTRQLMQLIDNEVVKLTVKFNEVRNPLSYYFIVLLCISTYSWESL